MELGNGLLCQLADHLIMVLIVTFHDCIINYKKQQIVVCHYGSVKFC